MWAPYQQLDLNPEEMVSEEDIQRIIRFAEEFTPQTNSGRPAYKPNDPKTERPLHGYKKGIHASEISITYQNNYTKAVQVREGVERILVADSNGMARRILSVGLQFHTVKFDHPTDGIDIPDGWDWRWAMTIPHCVFEARMEAWQAAGYTWSPNPSIELAAEETSYRGWPVGWALVNPEKKVIYQYTVCPDLRRSECRKFFLDRYEAINSELGLVRVQLGGKSAWFHGRAAPYAKPETPRSGPWLPSPYLDDSYRYINAELIKEAVARFGAENVTWTNTGRLTAKEMYEQGLPAYVGLRDGGIRELYDDWCGSWVTNWLLPSLIEKGAL